VLRRLAADERAAGIAAAGGDATHQAGDGLGIQPADGDVVEERERLGAAADHVVRAHRDEIDADRVPAPSAAAIAVFVPTPSVEETISGLR
jgi:hypothetical protein